MRVLLTGIGGSIGCHTFRHIMHATDWHVVGIDSWRHGGISPRVQVMLDAHPEDAKRLTLLTHDLTSPISKLLAKRIGPIDYIINMASLSDVHDSIQNPRPFIEANVAIGLTVLEFARRFGCRAFMQISTDEVYGPTNGRNTHREWDPIVPSNPYSASKAAQEGIAISYWRSYNIPLIIVNLMNNFGEMQSPKKFPAIVQRKIRAGEKITVHGDATTCGSRVYIHSRNSADAFVYILNNVDPWLHVDGRADKPERFNIVGDAQIRNDQLVEDIGRMVGKRYEWAYADANEARPGHDLHYGLDGEKLFRLGWKQPLDFHTSMANTVAWYEEHPEWLDPNNEH